MSPGRALGFVFVLGALAGCGKSGSSVGPPVTRVVTLSTVSYPHFSTIQAAVDAAKPGDWILIDSGVYHGPVVVRTAHLRLRGMDRNAVVLDGQHQAGNGIEVVKVDGVSIENLTVHDFDRASPDGQGGNEIWWNGGDGSGRIGLHDWNGRYLTTFDTGLLGGYGLFISNAESGSLDHSYASGFNDSGVYLGACRDCDAVMSNLLVENNALGYSGTNASGHVLVRDSIFRFNSNGIGPNSLNNDDQPPPQDGSCDSGDNTSATPTFSSTSIARCTIFENNIVSSNGNFSAPANSIAASVPWGNGFVLVGTYADLISGNSILGNPSAGILGFENPNPFPATADTIYFQLSGNAVVGNTFARNATNPDPSAADITVQGGSFGSMQSTNNCFSGNTLTTTIPPLLEGAWGCDQQTTPNPGSDAINYIFSLQTASQARTAVPQPVPPPQPTMPFPCDGAPANPLCP